MKRFRQIIIRPCPEPTHPVPHISAGGKQNDGSPKTASSKLLKYRNPIDAGKHDVEHDGIVRTGSIARTGGLLCQFEPLFARANGIHSPASAYKRVLQWFANELCVLYQQQSHARPLSHRL